MIEELQPIEPADVARLIHLDRSDLTLRLKLFLFDLLTHDVARLFQLMYTHDVNEQLVYEALLLPDDDQRAEAIAHLVIEREMQKIKSREAYRQATRNNPNPS
ncbi:MAG: hypothetical protein WCR58_03265 [Bacteroidales bacterium]|nr:hypothetical protein [Bacteroidales bacterium]MDD3701288.1 hypothetical protein [Bacteroidales bacterium]MDY0368417.1 hypothetical protein [Bacteroidales bacterium]